MLAAEYCRRIFTFVHHELMIYEERIRECVYDLRWKQRNQLSYMAVYASISLGL
jgi:hypothetical protein